MISAGGVLHQSTGRLRNLSALRHPSLSSSPVSIYIPLPLSTELVEEASTCPIITFTALVVYLACSVAICSAADSSLESFPLLCSALRVFPLQVGGHLNRVISR
ncbi:hypothetical protein RvY_18790 [Ramazzottius varieornatus]|uniref:Uncharacterized protein n=1 Tax=Ramazzottius varieornatus TaxID=947166 RepID=A0A1D1W775_RAMVA|nr:hypothetical protein RvY_18790 [Ramazzottius varieornatus]